MKKSFISLLLLQLSWTVFGQKLQPQLPHIKVLLVGTFHYGDTGDKNRTAFEDLFSPKRQAQLQALTSQLARLKPNKIFVENEPDRQAHWDSVLTLYQHNRFDTTSTRNEIFQVGARIAAKAGLTQLICVDHHQSLPYDKLQAFERKTEKDSVAQKKMAAYKLLSFQYPYPKQTQKLATSTLINYYLYINSPQADASNRADYFVYSPAYGYDDDYTGVDMITSWYERNARIFTNILRKAEPTDQLYIVLFGSSHMLPLRHYFQNNPFFEVMELSSTLKAD